MNSWNLPTSVHVTGVDWDINTDFRVVLDVLAAYNNEEYDKEDKHLYLLIAMIKDFDNMDESDYEEATKKLIQFIDMGIEDDIKKPKPRLMDWEQDAAMIVPAVNKVLGKEIRAEKYVHWWSFMAAYMEIGECSFSHILNIRTKQAKHKKLEKWELEFIRENENVVNLKKKMTERDKEEQKALDDLLGR